MQHVNSEKGLVPSDEVTRRCTCIAIHNANDSIASFLIAMWAQKTPDQAHAQLSRHDITVTNQSDKDDQLKKLHTLNEDVKSLSRGQLEA